MSVSPKGWLRPVGELHTELSEQMSALQSSCAAYDLGTLWEAKRIATTICILVDDRKRVTSLLTRLNLLDALELFSTTVLGGPKNLLASWHLVGMNVSFANGEASVNFQPPLEEAKKSLDRRPVSFSNWWNEPVFRERPIGDRLGGTLSRKGLIQSMRDQDGGSHFDGELRDEVYAAFAKENAVGIQISDKHGSRDIPVGPLQATVRQIGWEIEQSISSLKARGLVP